MMIHVKPPQKPINGRLILGTYHVDGVTQEHIDNFMKAPEVREAMLNPQHLVLVKANYGIDLYDTSQPVW